jgi:hypothetical protein
VTHQPLGSHYQLHERIGQGGMGVVWRALDVSTESWYAIKVLNPDYLRDSSAVARFIRERSAMVALRHPHIVPLHDMIVEGEQYALVMDLLPDGDLNKCRRDRGGILPPREAAELMAQVCAGLAATITSGGYAYHQYRNGHSGLCLDVSGSSAASGAHLVQSTCSDTSDHAQFWRNEGTAAGRDDYHFVNYHSGMCMDIQGSSLKSGAKVLQGNCSNSGTQSWLTAAGI